MTALCTGLWIPTFLSTLNMPEYGCLIPHGRVLDMLGQHL